MNCRIPVAHGADSGRVRIAGFNNAADKRPSYHDGISLIEPNENITGVWSINRAGIERLEISKHGINGTLKIYSVKRAVKYKNRWNFSSW